MNTHASESESFGGWLDCLARHKVKAFVFFVAAMGCVVAATSNSTRWYASEGALYFRLGRENATVDPTAAVGSNSPIFSLRSREREINSITAILSSRGMAEALVDAVGPESLVSNSDQDEPGMLTRLGVKPELSLREKAVSHVMKKLKVEAKDDANIVWLTFEAKKPETAQEIVQAMMDCYLKKHLEFHRTAGSRVFLESQALESKQRLADLEAQLTKAREQTALVSLEEQRQAMVSQAASLELSLLENEANLASLQKRVAKLQTLMNDIPQMHVTQTVGGVANQAADRMRDRLYAQQINEQQLLTRYTADHPLVVNARKEIAKSKSILEAENDPRTQVTEGVSRAFEAGQLSMLELQPSVAAAEAKSVAIRSQLKQANARLVQMNQDELQLRRLSRDVEIADAEYRRYAAGLNNARLDEALNADEISSVNIVQPPTLSAAPVRPNWSMNLAAGFILSLLGAYGFAGLLDAWRPSQQTVAEDAPELSPVPRPSAT